MLHTKLHNAGAAAVGEIVLDNPKSLNALSPADAIALKDVVLQWRDDAAVAAAVLRGAGERAFCAGGDVRAVCALVAAGEFGAVDQYFADEYRADYALHCFGKPLIGFGGGVVMGGGMGILQGCNIRIVTAQSKMAMPEHKIGFFPDVGAALFCKKFNGAPQSGFYVGLSGKIFTGAEALQLGAADFLFEAEHYPALLEKLTAAKWRGDAAADFQTAREIVLQTATQSADDAAYDPPPFLEKMYSFAEAGNWRAAVEQLPEGEREAAENGSPLSHMLWTELYCRRAAAGGAKEQLRQTFLMDYILAQNVSRRGDFLEGVRALLVDKDNNPQWQDAPDDVGVFFEPPAPKTSAAFLESLKQISE